MLISVVCLVLFVASTNCVFTESDDVISLTDKNFDQVVSSKGVWFVMFYAPWCGHCKNLVPEWKLFATQLKGILKVAAVDCDANPDLSKKYEIKSYPTIKIFGENKYKPTEYSGSRTVQSFSEEGIRQIASTINIRTGQKPHSDSGEDAVIELTDSNFDKLVLESEEPWLVEFFAPWCGHCKNLKPHWEQAAKQLKGTIKMAALDATVHRQMTDRYGIRGFPTIKFFPAGKKSDSPVDYDGGRTSDDIVAWANDKVEKLAPAPELVEILDQNGFNEACQDRTLCIISVLPVLYDCQSACRNKYLDLIRREADVFKRQKWGWIWTEAMKHSDLEKALDIGGFGYPAMVAVHGRKMKRTTMRGAFNEAGVHDFLRSLSVGGSNLPLFNIKTMPTIGKVDRWNGDDAPPIEEEDLDDDDDNDDDDDSKSEL